jgi:hypothetical protein
MNFLIVSIKQLLNKATLQSGSPSFSSQLPEFAAGGINIENWQTDKTLTKT